MKFSEAFNVVRAADDDWFDALLHTDTDLFPDPFLIFQEATDTQWVGSHDDLIAFFNLCLSLVAMSEGNQRSVHWQAAARLLRFPEPSEFCLGYGDGSTHGSGTGTGLGRGMLGRCVDAIGRGINEVEHIE